MPHTAEIDSTSIRPLPQWEEVVRRHAEPTQRTLLPFEPGASADDLVVTHPELATVPAHYEHRGPRHARELPTPRIARLGTWMLGAYNDATAYLAAQRERPTTYVGDDYALRQVSAIEHHSHPADIAATEDYTYPLHQQ